MTEREKQLIARIDELSGLARTAWFGLLAYLAFVGITLLGVTDADFFVPTRQTELPVVGVTIPTLSFFAFAPLLGAALYIYLHLNLIKLWDTLAASPAAIDGEHMHAWLVNDFALALRADGALRVRPMTTFARVVTLFLVWIAAPLVLLAFWWRSMPAHVPAMSGLIGLVAIASGYAGATSWWTATRRLRHRQDDPKPWYPRWRVAAAALLAAGLMALGWLRTEGGGIDGRLFDLAAADLVGVELVARPADWLSPETGRARFRATWCSRNGLPPLVCGRLAATDAPPDMLAGARPGEPCPRFPPGPGACADRPVLAEIELAARADWCIEINLQPVVCDAHFEALEDAFRAEWREERAVYLASLPALELVRRDLRGANLARAFLPGADLERVRLEGANLHLAVLEGASLFGAQLGDANLREARMENAFLFDADLRGAVLLQARLAGATLSGARLDGAELSGTLMPGADLSSASLIEARLHGSDLSGANFLGADLSGALMSGARLEGTVLSQARLSGATLHEAMLTDVQLVGADLRHTDWRGAAIGFVAAHGADFTGARNLTQAQLARVIGDDRTRLPSGPASDTGAPWRLASCWREPPPTLARMTGFASLYTAKSASRLAADWVFD
jgi:uncharacterized protein YjbI with pentapeptide repeats